MLYKASGGFDYVDRETYRQAPTGPLLTLEQARRFAVPFLRSHGLLPSGTLRIAARADATVVVVTATPLLSGAPVLDGAITFWLGAGGAITRLRDEYRPLAAPVRVAARPNAAILKEVRDDLGTTTGIRLRLAYVAQPSYLDQPYLDPVFEAVAQGLVLDRVRATTFTPRVEITSPSASTPILAGDPAALRAKAIEGRGPYRYAWSANATGFLGNGKALDVALAAADTEIRLTVRDASGAGTTYAQPVSVIGPAAGPPAAPQSGGTYRRRHRQLRGRAGSDASAPLQGRPGRRRPARERRLLRPVPLRAHGSLPEHRLPRHEPEVRAADRDRRRL